MKKVRAYVLEYLKVGDDGKPKILPSEVALRYYCSAWYGGMGEEDERNENLMGGDDPYQNISVKEYPECECEFANSACAETWGERLGINVDWEDIDNCGGVWYGEDEEGERVRIRREYISGEWSEKTKAWLDRFPFIILGIAKDF